MVKIIGIGGISRSGKTELANSLVKALAPKSAVVLSQDEFIMPEEEIPMINGHIDWEVPESIDFEKLKKTILKEKQASDFVIVEGLFAFTDPQIHKMYDFTIQLHISKQEFVRRKNSDLRWGKEPDWYVEYVWKSFLKYGQFPDGGVVDVRVDGEEEVDVDGIFRMMMGERDAARDAARDANRDAQL